jgi:predicted alpha/beta-hydrolase family hydrolase
MNGEQSEACLVLAHGAASGMDHPLLDAIAEGLALHRIATLRFNFPYMQSFSRTPDRPELLYRTVRAAIGAATELLPATPIFSGGRSFGALVASEAEAEAPSPDVNGLVCIGFPLHPASNPSLVRARHLREIDKPVLIVQGSDDQLAQRELLVAAVETMEERATLHWVHGADHSFKVAKGPRFFSQAAVDQVVGHAARWVCCQLGQTRRRRPDRDAGATDGFDARLRFV